MNWYFLPLLLALGLVGLRLYFKLRSASRSQVQTWDEQVIARLRNQGYAPFNDYPVDFFLALPDEAACERAAARLAGEFKVDVNPLANDSQLHFSLHATRSMRLVVPDMQEISRRLTALAAELGGRYDGWAAAGPAAVAVPAGAAAAAAPSGGRLRVAIIYGGQSAEHEISILSARNVLAALDPERFEPLLIGIDKAGQWLAQDAGLLLASATDARQAHIEDGVLQPVGPGQQAAGTPPIDVIFPVLHGTLGEDGCIQGLFEVAGIPYVGAGVLGSAIGMDKDVMKRLLHEAGIAVARFFSVRRAQFDAQPQVVLAQLATLGFPLFTKPANAGSSVGVRRVAGSADLEAAVRHAFEFDDKILAEAAVSGREIELAVLGGTPPRVSVAGEIVVQHPDGFYSYDAKYLDENGARLELPAQLTQQQLQRAQQLAAQVFEVLECDGLARVDLFLTPAGELLVNEINTLPGFTAISMYPKLWGLSGMTPMQLVSQLIDLALERGRRRAALRAQVTRGSSA